MNKPLYLQGRLLCHKAQQVDAHLVRTAGQYAKEKTYQLEEAHKILVELGGLVQQTLREVTTELDYIKDEDG